MRTKLGIDGHVYRPVYRIEAYRNGNPAKRIRSVDFGSVLAIQTSKNVTDVAGTWSIVLKDPRALDRRTGIREMDVLVIYLGRSWHGIDPIMLGVVDTVTQAGSAASNSADQTVTISGRCVGKYLQVTSMFLPVWDSNKLLPTTLTFGVGSSGQDSPSPHPEVGPTPRAIFGYLLRRYAFGERKVVGAGIPNARFWLDYRSRMGSLNKFEVPYIQFNEDTLANALKTLEVPGFAETWVDEAGRVVYRRPQWDAVAAYSVWTGDLISWSFAESDESVATYVEVIPSGDPGMSASISQALLAGRAPVPKDYVNGTTLGNAVDRAVIIDTKNGKVTAKGAKNHWWQLQRRLGVRPQQVTSPMIGTQEQAQKQAEGLLRFYSRFTKTATIQIPGDPRVKLGKTMHLYGVLDGQRINRSYYIEGVQHDYQEGQSYTTTLTLTHGKDPGDPDWGSIVIPRYRARDAAKHGGVAWYGPSPYASLFDQTSTGGNTPATGGNTSGTSGGAPAGTGLGNTYEGSPVPGLKAHSLDHPTMGLTPPGSRDWYAYDYMAPAGTPCVAPTTGKIVKVSGHDPKNGPTNGPHGPLGWSVYVQGGSKTYFLTHLGSYSVQVGDSVTQGQKIGTVANYHKYGTPDHIHCGVHVGAFASSLGTEDVPTASIARQQDPPDRHPGPANVPGQHVSAYPLSRRGTFNGGAGIGTHSFTTPPNGWASDNAVDLNTPRGTYVFAVEKGVVESVHRGESGGRFNGYEVQIAVSGNRWFYAHLSRCNVSAGDHVDAGDVIGRSGSANGRAHLHIACQEGNPQRLLGV